MVDNNIDNTVDKRTALGIISIGFISFSGIISETSMNVAFPSLMKFFNVSLNTVQGLTSFYLLDVAIVMTLSAFLKQKFLERQLFFMALGSFLLGSIICIFSINFPMLLLGRLFQGISTGIGTPLLFNVILERIPHKVIGLWMGIGSLIISIAPSIGPSYGGLLVSTAGWRWIFIGLLTLPIIALFIGNRNLSNSIRIKNIVKLDLIAFILLSTTLTSFIIEINSIAKGNINIVLLIVFLLALGMYIWRSLTSSKIFLNIRVFSNSFFSFSLLFFGIYQFSNLAVNFIIPIFLENSKGTGSLLAGFSMLPGTLIGALFNPKVGKLYDAKGPKLGIIFGNVLLVISLSFLSINTDQLSFLTIMFLYIGFTVGRNFPMNTIITNTLDKISLSDKTNANAFFQTTNQFLGSLGTSVASLVVSNSISLEKGTHNLFILLLCLALFNFIGVFKILNKKSLD